MAEKKSEKKKLEKKSHTVVKGDTLMAISKKYGVSVDKIESLNKETLKNLKIGDKLVLN